MDRFVGVKKGMFSFVESGSVAVIDSTGSAFCSIVVETGGIQILLPDGTPAEVLTMANPKPLNGCGCNDITNLEMRGDVGPNGTPFAIKLDIKTLDVCYGKRGLTDVLIEERGVCVMRQPVVAVSWIPKLVCATAGVMCFCAYYLSYCFALCTNLPLCVMLQTPPPLRRHPIFA